MLRSRVFKVIIAMGWGAALLLAACSEHEIGNHPPVVPYNPNPADGATQVSRNANLCWQCNDPDGGPLTFDVYFGTDTNPPLAEANLTEIFFTPETMEANTKYYWRVAAKDNQGGENTSAVWSFTTGTTTNRPPNPPANPSPEDGATGVSVNVTLSWTCTDPENDPLTFDVYFGEDQNNLPLRARRHDAKSWSPGTLKASTIYYWRIIAYDDNSFFVVKAVVAADENGRPAAAAPAGNAAAALAAKKPAVRTAMVAGGTPGPVWRFTTAGAGDQPPDPPSNPDPSDGAENVGVDVDLSWTCTDPENDPLLFDIYFGTSSPPPLVKSNHGAKVYYPGTTEYLTKYYWKVVAKDNHGHQTPGPEWSYTTQGHGVFLGKWGSSGSSYGKFDNPYGIAVTPNGNVYVGGDDNYRIQYFR